VPHVVRGALAQLAARAYVACAALALLGASPPPHAASRSDRATVPTKPQHAEYVVDVNAKGQVVRVDSGKPSHDPAFNAVTYGNALQVFIRTTDGNAVAGVYRLTYEYDPASRNVRREVALIRRGGVDPNALGAVNRELQRRAAEKSRERMNDAAASPSPAPPAAHGIR
jgi:hypothetical protein